MSVWTGRFNLVGTGNQTMTLGNFQPTWATLIVVDNEGESLGAIASNQNVAWKWNNGATLASGEINTHCIKLPGGTGAATPRMLASFVSFGTSGSFGTITLNVTNYNATKVKILCGN